MKRPLDHRAAVNANFIEEAVRLYSKVYLHGLKICCEERRRELAFDRLFQFLEGAELACIFVQFVAEGGGDEARLRRFLVGRLAGQENDFDGDEEGR